MSFSLDLADLVPPPRKHRSHDTSRIAWAKLMARVGEEFPLECPNCGGDIRLIAFITQPGPIRKISHTSANCSSRRPSRPPGARPPTGANSCRPMTIATSFQPHLVGPPNVGGPPGGDDGPDHVLEPAEHDPVGGAFMVALRDGKPTRPVLVERRILERMRRPVARCRPRPP